MDALLGGWSRRRVQFSVASIDRILLSPVVLVRFRLAPVVLVLSGLSRQPRSKEVAESETLLLVVEQVPGYLLTSPTAPGRLARFEHGLGDIGANESSGEERHDGLKIPARGDDLDVGDCRLAGGCRREPVTPWICANQVTKQRCLAGARGPHEHDPRVAVLLGWEGHRLFANGRRIRAGRTLHGFVERAHDPIVEELLGA